MRCVVTSVILWHSGGTHLTDKSLISGPRKIIISRQNDFCVAGDENTNAERGSLATDRCCISKRSGTCFFRKTTGGPFGQPHNHSDRKERNGLIVLSFADMRTQQNRPWFWPQHQLHSVTCNPRWSTTPSRHERNKDLSCRYALPICHSLSTAFALQRITWPLWTK